MNSRFLALNTYFPEFLCAPRGIQHLGCEDEARERDCVHCGLCALWEVSVVKSFYWILFFGTKQLEPSLLDGYQKQEFKQNNSLSQQ